VGDYHCRVDLIGLRTINKQETVMIEWTPVAEGLPTPPATPYKMCLVWATSQHCIDLAEEGRVPLGYSGIAAVTQFSRSGEFFPIGEWEDLVITHWAEINAPPEVQRVEDALSRKSGETE
jgi:hypothetical protein